VKSVEMDENDDDSGIAGEVIAREVYMYRSAGVIEHGWWFARLNHWAGGGLVRRERDDDGTKMVLVVVNGNGLRYRVGCVITSGCVDAWLCVDACGLIKSSLRSMWNEEGLCR
jgi:hypothetical protein